MKPSKIFYEPNIVEYELGKILRKKWKDTPWYPIENHNNIKELRENSNEAFVEMKNYLIIGTRKTHKYVENKKVSDYLVPYTSSGCSAMCLYCYLVCNYNKCSYLRLFVNREQMLEKLIKKANKSEQDLTFEIGSNSDLVLENTLTGNLVWTIENFTKQNRGLLTFPTKFSMVDPLLDLDHKKRIIIRMSVNPQNIISAIELGTSSLSSRITAINKLCDAGYRVGLLLAPVIMVDGWETLYVELLQILQQRLSETVKTTMFIEVIFMTYSYVHRAINQDAFPTSIDLYNKELMTGRGRGKYCYRQDPKQAGESFLRSEIQKYFPDIPIAYVV